MSKTLSTAEINHLRRLLGWVACEIGQTPEEIIDTAKTIAPAVGEIDSEARRRLVDSCEKAAAVPKYVRDALKSLKKAIADCPGEVVDAEISEASPAALPDAARHSVQDAAKALWDTLNEKNGGIVGEVQVWAWYNGDPVEGSDPSIRVMVKHSNPLRWHGIPKVFMGYPVTVEDYQQAIAQARTQ